MARFSIGLLGGFEVRPASGSTALAPGKKIQALLAVLGVRAGARHSRDQLASLLWAGVGNEQARHSLRQAIFAIRRLLAEDVLNTLGETVALNRDVVAVDVVEFEQAAANVTAHGLERAAALYRGDLLDGFRLREPRFEEWVLGERERLRQAAGRALERLAQLRMEAGDKQAAIDSATRLLTLDPTREATHRTLMRLYLETGRRAAAIQQYHACQRVLGRELGVTPDADTRALYDNMVDLDSAAYVAADGRPLTPAAVLIVEDEPVTRAVLEGLLGKAGYDVIAVSNGAEALFHLSTRHFDLILSDIAMPMLDGLVLAEVIARKGLRTPVIFITGQPGGELEIKGLESGAVDFIRKPVQRDVLLLRIRKALRAH